MQEVSGQTKGQNPLLMDHPEDEPFQKAKANTFVGCKAVSAAEYHDADFTWEVQSFIDAWTMNLLDLA